MSFLHPYFLYGLAALAIPVIIHLFDFRRTRKVYFSNTRLLDQVKESTRSFYNLKHLLILLTRLLFIAALVIAFAQPFIAPRGEEGLSATRVGVFVDNSNSMSNRVGQDESGLNMAKETAIELVNLYPSGTEFIVQSAFEEASLNPYLSKQAAIEKITNLGFSSNSYSLQLILDKFGNNIASEEPKDIIMISDFQKSTLMKDEIKLDSQQHFILAPILFKSEQNVSLDSAFISNPFELDKTKTNLSVQVKNHSATDQEDVSVKLFLGERQLSVTTVDVEANGTAKIDFTVGQDMIAEEGRVVVEDYPLSFDNSMFFTLRSINKVNITQITGAGAGGYVSAVFGNSALFKLTSMRESNIDYSNLEKEDLIIINGVAKLNTSLAQRLLRLQQGGTTILIIPSNEPEIESYQLLVPNLTSVGDEGQVLELAAPDFSRPFYQNVVERRDNNLQMPEAQSTWNWGGDRNALLKFIDGRPFLSELRTGFFILASPLAADYSSFQTNALFVPIMYRVAANSQQNIDPLYYRIDGEEISVSYDDLQPNSIIRLKNNDLEFLPDQRLTARSIDMLLPRGIVPAGHYQVLANQQQVKSIALNLQTNESEIEASNELELVNVFKGYDYNIIAGAASADIVAKFSAEYKGIVLWRYFLGLALVFLFIEALLIRLL